jgi:hypothetical protein
VIFLDRHHVNCQDSQAMKGWHLTRPSGDKISMAYDCAVGRRLGGVSQHETTRNKLDKGEVVYLDRHDVSCPAGSVLKSWRVQNPSGQLQVKYECVQGNVYNCSQHESNRNGVGSRRQATFLDQHPLWCPADKAMQRWKMNTHGGDKVNFSYTCCDVD